MNNYFFTRVLFIKKCGSQMRLHKVEEDTPSIVCLILHHEELKKAAPAVLGTLPGLNLVKT